MRHDDDHRANEARVREYLNIEQLAALTPWTVEATSAMVRRGALKLGIHYFQPLGPRGQRIFKWSAIVELIEGSRPNDNGVIQSDEKREPLRVEEATQRIRRLLG